VRIDEIQGTLTFMNPLKPSHLPLTPLHRSPLSSPLTSSDLSDLVGPHSLSLHYLLDSLLCNLPILALTNDPHRLISNLRTMALATGQTLNRILLNDRSDTS
jgi:hypothetical protein